MGVPTSEVGYTIATTRRETTKVHKNMWWHWGWGRLSEPFLILRRTERHIVIIVYWSSFSCRIVMKLNLLDRLKKKSSDVKFHENPSSGSRVVPCGRTDRRDEANCHFSQFLRTKPHNRRTSIPSAGSEPAIPTSMRLQSHTLCRTVTRIGIYIISMIK